MTIFILYIVLGLIFWQDIRYRGVHWFLFPVLLTTAVFFNWSQLEWSNLVLNLAFLSLLLLGLTLYLSLKLGRIVNITRGYFSWGDILFLIAIIPLFEWKQYMFIFITGTIASLILHLAASIIKPRKTVPFAGYMALVLLCSLPLLKSINIAWLNY